MAELETGLWLQQYVEPQLLEDFRNFKDDFIGTLGKAPASAIDKDGIRFNKLINNVDFYVNKNTPFVPKKMEGKKGLVEWDKLDTSPTEYTDAELRAMAFDKENQIRVAHTESFKIGVRDYVMHKLAPKENVDGKMPVIRTTGAVYNGRKRLTYADLLQYYIVLERLNLNNKDAWYMILNANHRADLIHDRASTNNYRDIEIDKNTGEIKSFFKLKFFENNDAPLYNAAGKLKARGSVKEAQDQEASIFYYQPNTVYHIEKVKILHKPMEQDTRSADPTSEVRLHTYGLCDKKQEYGFGAIVSDNA
ncbi:hypothetical protein [Riemerella anatipestifer]|uniref:hypothetical protein n=1 Tax=Riemerella anatipestifer TaxID=34085 RepID=UPI003DA87AA5